VEDSSSVCTKNKIMPVRGGGGRGTKQHGRYPVCCFYVGNGASPSIWGGKEARGTEGGTGRKKKIFTTLGVQLVKGQTKDELAK